MTVNGTAADSVSEASDQVTILLAVAVPAGEVTVVIQANANNGIRNPTSRGDVTVAVNTSVEAVVAANLVTLSTLSSVSEVTLNHTPDG